MATSYDVNRIIQALLQGARQRGIDPHAVLAVARQEGLNGGVGDGGTSFGPFQLHAGGALPSSVWSHGAQYADQWAKSEDGLAYALDRIASVARGLRGAQAVNAIVRRFERPADPDREVRNALAAYGIQVPSAPPASGAAAGVGGMAAPARQQQSAAAPPSSASSTALNALLGLIYSQNAQRSGTPISPVALALLSQ